jgi:hypothetical protein
MFACLPFGDDFSGAGICKKRLMLIGTARDIWKELCTHTYTHSKRRKVKGAISPMVPRLQCASTSTGEIVKANCWTLQFEIQCSWGRAFLTSSMNHLLRIPEIRLETEIVHR